ncbi:MAG: murein L,D-transpeptidase catalytic domain-containing protein [Ferruginibacter sp.]
MQRVASAGIIFSLITLTLLYGYYRPHAKEKMLRHENIPRKSPDNVEKIRLQEHAFIAKKFIQKNKLCERICFLVDMRISSGRKRFFVYDPVKDSVLAEGLVTHGSGSATTTEALQFSNTVHSKASSLGMYKTGAEYSGKFGTAFKLFGLEHTNDNAYRRAVVLHAHPLVPPDEVWPDKICTSWGCPTVNPAFLKMLKKHINHAGKPVLLWIFY